MICPNCKEKMFKGTYATTPIWWCKLCGQALVREEN